MIFEPVLQSVVTDGHDNGLKTDTKSQKVSCILPPSLKTGARNVGKFSRICFKAFA